MTRHLVWLHKPLALQTDVSFRDPLIRNNIVRLSQKSYVEKEVGAQVVGIACQSFSPPLLCERGIFITFYLSHPEDHSFSPDQ